MRWSCKGICSWTINLLITLINLLILIVPVLINVAFVTLLERKILGLRQLRLGPNKNRFVGVLQPFSDAIKLFIKQIEKIIRGNSNLYILSPSLAFITAIILWRVMPTAPLSIYSRFSVILFLIILSLGVYPVLLAGWSSLRKYALIGRVRGVAQTISYEISLALIMIIILVTYYSARLDHLRYFSCNSFLLLIGPLVFLIWIISIVAETNRTPFDFAEGESELVSGFNIEYASVGFALIFIAEYARILVLSTISVSLFFPVALFRVPGATITTALAFFWIWVRSTYPRYRYDLLMSLAWKSLLPLTLGVLRMIRAVVVFL